MLAGKRAVRVGDQLLKVMAEMLMKKVNDPRVKTTTLTGIHLSDDLKHARIFIEYPPRSATKKDSEDCSLDLAI